jgi:hypothetical protein
MRSMSQTGWAGIATFFSAAVMAAGMSFVTTPAQAAFELPEGEKITNLPAIPRAIPQKEAYEIYDPKIGKNFDIKNFWVRADLRVRPELRNGTCFGGGSPVGGACNTLNANANGGKSANDSFVMQMTRLGIGYDVSPDVNFYMELIQSSVWGANGVPGSTGSNYDALNHNGSSAATNGNGGVLGVRAAYMLIRNFAGVQGLSVKAGRQYVSFGQQSLLGTFDWANTGFSHDGIMLQYSTKTFDSWLGAFRESEGDLAQAAPVGSTTANVAGGGVGQQGANADSNMLVFYNQIKSVPGFLIEPYYILYSNQNPTNTVAAQTTGTPKSQNQTRHTIGNRIEFRKGNIDATNELVYQFGAMGASPTGQNANSAALGNQKDIHINAWATRNWIGYTLYQNAWKPRLAVNYDYASGDDKANCTLAGSNPTGCRTANTFENLFPTNHIHMGYMDVQAWKNMSSPSVNFQARPTKDDHIEFWYTDLNLANKNDNWYRGTQGVYVFSKNGNQKTHIGDELDIAWTHMFMDGKVAFQAAYGYLWSGGYIQQNLNTSSNQEWAYAQLWINF